VTGHWNFEESYETPGIGDASPRTGEEVLQGRTGRIPTGTFRLFHSRPGDRADPDRIQWEVAARHPVDDSILEDRRGAV